MILPDVLSRMHVSSRMRARGNKLIVKLGLTEVPVSKHKVLSLIFRPPQRGPCPCCHRQTANCSPPRDVKRQSICCQELVGLYILYKHTVQTRLILPRLLVRGTSRPTWPHTYGCGKLHLPSQDILCTSRSIYPALVLPEDRPSTSGGDEPQPKPPVTLAPALLSQPRGNLPGPAPHVHGIYAPEFRPYPPPSCWRLNLGTKWSSRLS